MNNNNSNNDNKRNVQQRTLDRHEPFIKNLSFTMRNISTAKNQTAGSNRRSIINPSNCLISLQQLIHSGTQYRTNLILMVLSISTVTGNNFTQYQQRQKGNIRSEIKTVRHDRRMVVMCPLSDPDNNTAVILFGSGCCERLFEWDIAMRDNGQIRK